MALTVTEQNQIRTLIAREGGLAAFREEVEALSLANTQATTLATLAPAIRVTVSDWPALSAYVAQAGDTFALLPKIMSAISVAAGARDASTLGPLFVALYAAAKGRWSLG